MDCLSQSWIANAERASLWRAVFKTLNRSRNGWSLATTFVHIDAPVASLAHVKSVVDRNALPHRWKILLARTSSCVCSTMKRAKTGVRCNARLALTSCCIRTAVESWLEQVEKQILVIYYATSDRVVATSDIPKQIRRKAVYFLKSKNIDNPIVKVEELKAEVACGEISESALSSLSLLSHEVIYPLLSNPANRSGWSGPTSKEVMLKFSNFLASLHMTVGQSKVRIVVVHCSQLTVATCSGTNAPSSAAARGVR